MRLTNKQFCDAVDYVRENKETLLEKKPNNYQLARLIGEKIGCLVSKNSVTQIKEQAGVQWGAGTTVRNKSTSKVNTIAMRKLILAVEKLNRKMEEWDESFAPVDISEIKKLLYGKIKVASVLTDEVN